ncbi:MAG: hypothetical protein M1831_001187 [Alyxoria varia]|nr:MAG: hypothetical protein M1831_001187 [Alyxoria varia]
MKIPTFPTTYLTYLAILGSIPHNVLATDVLSTKGFMSCLDDSKVKLKKMDIQFDKSTNQVNFDVGGRSQLEQNVTAVLSISAYGKQIYSKSFDPCKNDPHVEQLCPVPKGDFSAAGKYKIPESYSSMIPAIAYNVPDLDAKSKMQLKTKDGNGKEQDIACYESNVTNDKTAEVPGVSYAAAAIAAGALLVSGLSALAGGASKGAGSQSSPTFTEVIWYFQGIAMNGMMSVQHPSVYRSFTSNFAFSTGFVPWTGMQKSIDNFRSKTGGNLTGDSVENLENSQLIFQQPGSSSDLNKRAIVDDLVKRALVFARDVETSVNGSSTGDDSGAKGSEDAKEQKYVKGIEAYVAKFVVPKSNTFMTVLLIFAIVLAAIAAGILLFKAILEAWALFGKFPKKLTSFRKHYWWILAKTNTNLILVLYGVWTLYCVFQFTQGDSWAAKVLAGVTLGLFTLILVGFTWKIWSIANKFKKLEGDSSAGLHENKEVWRKYSIFYDNYKKNYWWIFVPAIVYMFLKGCFLAGANNHSLTQTAGLLIVEALFLILLLWLRPYSLKSGNWINISIQVVRVVSVVCILVFVEQLGFSQTTQTVTGVALIVVQGVLTGVLGILIAVNAIINCVKMNPHRRARKEREKAKDLDALTPLDAHNSLLMYPMDSKDGKGQHPEMVTTHARGRSENGYDMLPLRDESNDRLAVKPGSAGTDVSYHDRTRSISPVENQRRQPQLPDLGYKGLAI